MTDGIKVYSFKGAEGVGSASPFCLKLLTWLRMADIAHHVHVLARPPSSTTGKVPYVELEDGSLLEDSERIIDVLTREHGVVLDAQRTEADRAQSVLLRSLAESNLYFFLLWSRWQTEAGWAVTKEVYFGDAPFLVRPLITRALRNRVVRDLWGQGTGRERPAFIEAQVAQGLATLDEVLGEQDFFLGTPGRIDATVHGLLANVHHWPHEDVLKKALIQHPRLVRFVERVDERWWAPAAV